MDARIMLDNYAEQQGWKKNKPIGWSEAADFAEWFLGESKIRESQTKHIFVGDNICNVCGKDLTFPEKKYYIDGKPACLSCSLDDDEL